MRVVVTGATGNLGTSVVRALADDPTVESIVGLARRTPRWSSPKTTVRQMDLSKAEDDALDSVFADADAVVHLAWLFQPTRDPVTTWRTNVLGSLRVFEAVARCAVPALVYSSSVGAYSPGPKDRRVAEDWPTHGWPAAAYTREKAYLERVLDAFEAEHEAIRVVRIRPGFVFQREAASEQRRLFLGPFVPTSLLRPGVLPVVPNSPSLRMQVVHASDVGEAFRSAVTRDVRGAFNVAADEVVDGALLARLLDARPVPTPTWLLRAALAAAWTLRLVPASPQLFDALVRLPLMDTTRARTELGWRPRHSATEAITEWLAGLREHAGGRTPPLASSVRGGRLGELATGVGKRA
ncbi:NAD-dependent epimerase/dehydratase family protein [Saccharomonospora glauca]|jgi:nucleoside-diphosphate-sugar epimerase|uniref:Nucleoside-diphosphate-sugar epimerase n=1 Tax=Saccharomonospora glauca K62 TaxID=928724 RepID=I1CZS0_9PSEU|nr:NAD-dependent epimerase/dehydratase family protein [Saccharomonospora glauca]EIE98194.1 nucleoside-diphosphate-sugar epimerase [Saccharomonospora glauca K62]